MKIKSRAKAKKEGSRTYFTGEPCKNGHIADRAVANYTCEDCQRGRSKVASHNNRLVNKDVINQRITEWYHKTKVKRADHNKILCKAERQRNRARRNADDAHRRAVKLKATPSWIDKEAIKHIYKERLRLQNETGIKHHVHHIVPLRTKTCQGLHTHDNLIILTEGEHKWFHARPERLRLLW